MVAYIDSCDLVAHRVYFCEDYEGQQGNWVYCGNGCFKHPKKRKYVGWNVIRYVFHEVG